MRKTLGVGVVLVVAVGAPLAAWAASGGFGSSLDLQASKWTTNAISSSNSKFKPVPQLSGLNICAVSQVTATLSAELNGAPAGFQIRVDGGALMQPGAVRLVPAGPHASLSFSWVLAVSPFEANDHHSFEVEWRSPNGRKTTLERGDLNLEYQRGTQHC